MSLESEGRDTLATGFAATGFLTLTVLTTVWGFAAGVALRVRLLRGVAVLAGVAAVETGMKEIHLNSFILHERGWQTFNCNEIVVKKSSLSTVHSMC